MKVSEHSREGACKRRLHFGPYHAVELSCCGAESPASLDGASPEATPASPCHRSVQDEAAESGEHLLRSPTHDGGIRLARANAAAVTLGRGTGCFGLLLGSSSMAAAAGGLQQSSNQLNTALSSSRRSLERICSPAGLAHAGVRPTCSPPAAAVASLPPAPRKRSIEAAGLKASGQPHKERFRAARALQGMAPANTSELQEVRAWLTLLEAR